MGDLCTRLFTYSAALDCFYQTNHILSSDTTSDNYMEENKVVAIGNSSHIPEEVVFDILARVPSVKSLLRFRCVSKSFCFLISQPRFTEAHQKGPKNIKVLMAHRASDVTRHNWNIFTLGMDTSWREIQCCFRFFPIRNNSVHIDGVIYSINYYHISAFNVGDENFRMIAFPPGVSTSILAKLSPTVVEIKGEVAILDREHFK
ncbi:F-box protein At1g31080-like [Lycium ferocissimum]|uniref:F-box protein At1g31080-like n=1 Tax=Lycium ferocissimum TaxID=112874 RepID=UPI002814AEA0|nr:F-box protein At1g31080-like [Lycium ferocissimum]